MSIRRLLAAVLPLLMVVLCYSWPCLAGDSLWKREITASDVIDLKDIGGNSGSFSLSPNGDYIAFELQQADHQNHTYKTDWFVVPTGGGEPLNIGSGGDPVLVLNSEGRSTGARAEPRAKWSPDSRWIAYLRKDAGTTQLWRSRADGAGESKLTKNSADVLSFAWAADGQALYFEVGRDRDQIKIDDLKEGDQGYLLDDRFMHGSLRPLSFPCGQDPREVAPDSQACVPALWVVDLEKQNERPGTEKDRQVYKELTMSASKTGIAESRSVSGIVRNTDGSHIGWLENEKPAEFPGIFAPLTLYVDGHRCALSQCHGQLRELWWDRSRVVFLRREGHAYGQTALYVWTPGKQNSLHLIHRDEDKLESCGIADGRLICLKEGPAMPRRIVSIEIADGRLTTVFDPNPNFSQLEVGKVERLEWHDSFGNPTYGHLVLPPDYERSKRYPLVIVQYRSRGFLKGGVGDEFPIYPLAAKGFAVLSFDCPSDWDQLARLDFANDPNRANHESMKDSYERKMDLSALEIIIDRLNVRGLIDPGRVGITGLSHGADNVQYALAHSKRFAAAATSGAWTPSMYYYLNPNTRYREMVRTVWETTAGTELFDNLDKVDAPLLMQVSDTELLAALSVHIALKDAGRAIETYVFPDEYHIKWQPQHKVAVAERAIDWFRFWLQDYEDADPKKTDQYKRWRSMREKQQAANVKHDPEGSPIAP